MSHSFKYVLMAYGATAIIMLLDRKEKTTPFGLSHSYKCNRYFVACNVYADNDKRLLQCDYVPDDFMGITAYVLSEISKESCLRHSLFSEFFILLHCVSLQISIFM